MAIDRQAILTAGIDFESELGLELGPLNRPVIRRSFGKVIYVDYTDTESLRQRYAADANVPVQDIVDVDATWGGNTLQEAIGVGQQVDYIVASHVIEHVPDLIAWLGELAQVLKASGMIRFAIPDRRYSFDYLRGETRLSDVICAHMVHARVPQPHEVLDFTLNKTQVDTVAAWDGRIDDAALGRDFTFDGCMHLANDVIANGTYHDVHCWVFTPLSFARLMRDMAGNGLTDLGCDSFTDTSYGEFEFFVRVRTIADQDERVATWVRMEQDARSARADTRGEKDAAQEIVLQERDAQMAACEKKIAEMAASIRHMGAEIASLTARVREYECSRSWKVTAPLRAVVRAVRG